jgi:site-specific DNA-methyltransferase (adenine-specific)
VQPYYESGNVTLYHADCRDVIPSLGKFDLVLTDPPYALRAGQSEYRVTASVAVGLSLAAKAVKKKGALLCMTTSSGRGIDFTIGAVGKALAFNRVLIWHKPTDNARVAGPWQWDLITVLCFGRACFGDVKESALFTEREWGKETGHRAEVPLNVAQWLWRPMASEAESVLDPFMGSGSLLLPPATNGHRVVGIDTDEKHCESAAKRFSAAPAVLRASKQEGR